MTPAKPASGKARASAFRKAARYFRQRGRAHGVSEHEFWKRYAIAWLHAAQWCEAEARAALRGGGKVGR